MNKIEFIVPKEVSELEELPIFNSSKYTIGVFDEKILDFLSGLSKRLLKDDSINNFPEIVALGFWLRKANLIKIRNENEHLLESKKYKLSPRGKVFHVCPSNVDTMFVYSFVVSLLVGNKNILRLSSKTEEPQISRIFFHINDLVKSDFQELNSYINIISYPRDEEINKFISLKSNARIIWGGNVTVNTFKNIPSQPKAKDIVFPDRLSLMILKCDEITKLNDHELKKFLKQFENDSYTFNQLGCSSPQVVIFMGSVEQIDNTIEILIQYLSESIKISEADVSGIASLKLNKMVDDSINNIMANKKGNNIVTFIDIEEGVNLNKLNSCGGGYFYKKNIKDLSELTSINHSKIQTITYFGLSKPELVTLSNLAFGEGIDRIVPLGKALEFDYLWDGYNLFEELSRKISVIMK